MLIPASLTALGWNRRALNRSDFATLAQREGVEVITVSMKWSGFYGVLQNTPCIVLSDKLAGIEYDFVAWHEMAHHLLHSPEFLFYSPGSMDKAQRQADAVAACALIPQPLLRGRDYHRLWQYPSDMVKLRSRVYERFRI